MGECGFAFVHGPADGRGRTGLRGAGKRNMAFASHQPRGGVQADPARSGQIDFGPCVKVSEIGFRPRGAIKRFDVRLELDQIAGNESRRQPQVAHHIDQQPARIPARAASELERLLGCLYARFQADQVAGFLPDALVDQHKEINSTHRFARDRREVSEQYGARRRCLQKRCQILFQRGVIGEGELRRRFFEKEIERIVNRHFDDQVDFHQEFGRRFWKNDSRQIVAERILLPIEEVAFGQNALGITKNGCSGMRSGAQSDRVRRMRHRSIIHIVRTMVEGNVNSHGVVSLIGYEIGFMPVISVCSVSMPCSITQRSLIGLLELIIFVPDGQNKARDARLWSVTTWKPQSG